MITHSLIEMILCMFSFVCFLLEDPTVIPHLMSLLSNSLRTQEYITQIFSHCCKVFVGI